MGKGAASRFRLTGDLRLQLFAGLFALGTIHHELEFVLEQALVGPFAEYLERWSRVAPSIGWPSEVGVALHLANVAISLLILILPWRRELLCLLAVTFLLSQLASPDRIASHNSLMAGGLLVVLILGLAEWLENAVRRDRPARRRTDWCGWTLTGLAWICTLTYVFAFFYKLNPVWFSPASSAPAFLIHPVAPTLDRLGVPAGYRSILAAVAIYGTLLVELVLPLLLFLRPTSLLGCFIGLVFHLPMIAQGVVDFPVLIVAFYPAFLVLAETRELIRRCLARPTTARLAGALVLGWLGIRVIQRAPKLAGLYGNALGLDPLVMIVNTVLTSATLMALVHVTLVLGAWLLERRLRPTPEAGEAAGSEPPDPRSAARLGRRRPSRRSAPAAAAVLLVGAAFVYNNLGLFFGLPSAGAMIMYSGIANDRSNHLVMPRILLSDSYAYASIVRFEPRGIDTRESREFVAAIARLDGRNQPYQLNLNLLRYQLNRICRSAPGGTVGLTLRTEEGRMLDFANACAEPTMLWHSVIPIGARCNPACGTVLRDWARGDLQSDSSCPTGSAMGCEPGAAQ